MEIKVQDLRVGNLVGDEWTEHLKFNQTIKIEFKEARQCLSDFKKFAIMTDKMLNDVLFAIPKNQTVFESCTPYIPTQDPMLDREHILTQLGITKEQDEANQKEWSKL